LGDTEHVTVGGNSSYTNIADLPPLVRGAIEVASSQNFDHSCAPQQGRLISVLERGFDGQRVGEIGTGCGVGLAWMVEATNASTSFVSIELDETRTSLSAHLFADHPNVRVLHGDWSELGEHGPFDLLVLDGEGKGKEPADEPPLDPTDGWLALGGTVVVDDFAPSGQTGASTHDEARPYWLEHPALHATELRLSSNLAAMVGSRFR
jgi:predicted O-methyltransferase YrrM